VDSPGASRASQTVTRSLSINGKKGCPIVVRWQIISRQPDKTAAFYQKLFDWQLSKSNAMGYRELRNNDKRGIDGGVWPAPSGQNDFVQLFIEVDDIDECIIKAIALGAAILVPPSVLPDGDAMAVLVGPTGLSFGLCKLSAD
jgi:uncharacterized protein